MKENKLTTNINLIKKAQEGDLNSLEELLKNIEKDVYSMLYYLLNNDTDAYDLTQEVLLKVSKKLNSLREVNLFKQWLNKIILREYYDNIRRNSKYKNLLAEDIGEIDNCNGIESKKFCPQKNCINNELSYTIKNSISKLSEPHKLAIILRELDGMSYDEIAKATRTSVGTVKSRIARARAKLKEYIKPYME